MTTWRILSNYRAFGLAGAVDLETERLRRAWGKKPSQMRSVALIVVRTALVQAINNGSFNHV